MRAAVRRLKNNEAVNLDEMDENLAEAVEIMKTASHYKRHHVHEAMPFVRFFLDLLQSVDIFNLELTDEGAEAMDVLRYASQDEGFRVGNLLDVDDLLELLDRLVEGRLIEKVDPDRDGEISEANGRSEWGSFFSEMIPFDVTLHLDVYVRLNARGRLAEERTNFRRKLDKELGGQEVDPSKNTAVDDEQYPAPK